MFERFTEHSRRVLFFSRYEASQTGSTSIEAQHLVLGLVRDRNATIRALLERHGLTFDEVTALMAPMSGEGTLGASVEIPFSPAVKRVLQNAALQADRLKSAWIENEHLLLGVLQDASSPVTQALNGRGMTIETVREALAESGVQSAVVLPDGVPDYLPSDTVHISYSPSRTPGAASRAYPGLLLLGLDLADLVAAVHDVARDRVVVPPPLADGRLYDLVLRPTRSRDPGRLAALAQQAIEQHFRVILMRETREGEEWVVVVQDVGV